MCIDYEHIDKFNPPSLLLLKCMRGISAHLIFAGPLKNKS